MNTTLRNPTTMAVGGTLAAIGIVALFVWVQAPDEPAAPLELVSHEPSDQPTEPPPDDVPAPPKDAPPPLPPSTPSPPNATQSPSSPADLPTPSSSSSLSSPSPIGQTGAASAAASSSGSVVEASGVGTGSYRVRFENLDEFSAMEQDRDVQVLVQTTAGHRYLLPFEVLVAGRSKLLTREVTDEEYEGWISQGRVQQLGDDRELRERLELTSSEYTLLAVLDHDVLAAIRDAAAQIDADAHRSILVLRRGPSARVALARR